MQHISDLFRKQTRVGKTMIAAFVFLVICCLCIIPFAFLDSSKLGAEINPTQVAMSVIPSMETSALTVAIEPTATSIIHTNTIIPTRTQTPTKTNQQTAEFSFTPTNMGLVGAQSCIPANLGQTAKVVDVVDGDTIKVLLEQDGQTYSVRYIGIDTPEYTNKLEYFGAEAAVKNVQLVFGKTVTLI